MSKSPQQQGVLEKAKPLKPLNNSRCSQLQPNTPMGDSATINCVKHIETYVDSSSSKSPAEQVNFYIHLFFGSSLVSVLIVASFRVNWLIDLFEEFSLKLIIDFRMQV